MDPETISKKQMFMFNTFIPSFMSPKLTPADPHDYVKVIKSFKL